MTQPSRNPLTAFLRDEDRKRIDAIASNYGLTGSAPDQELKEGLTHHMIDLLRALGANLRLNCLDSVPQTSSLAGKNILDVGCGKDGRSTDIIAHPKRYEPWLCRLAVEMGIQVTGMDIPRESPTMIVQNGRWAYLPHNLYVAGPWKLPDESQDAVICNSVVHTHCPDQIAPEIYRSFSRSSEDRELYLQLRERLISEIRRVLRGGGRLILNSECYVKSVAGWDLADYYTQFIRRDTRRTKPPGMKLLD